MEVVKAKEEEERTALEMEDIAFLSPPSDEVGIAQRARENPCGVVFPPPPSSG